MHYYNLADIKIQATRHTAKHKYLNPLKLEPDYLRFYIRETAFEKFTLCCMHIYHSLGTVKTGEICLFVFVSSPRRKEVFKALEYIVEEIKAKYEETIKAKDEKITFLKVIFLEKWKRCLCWKEKYFL